MSPPMTMRDQALLGASQSEPCVPELWSQTTGSGEVGFNSSGVIGCANNLSAGNVNIGKTLTSFTMRMKRANTLSQPLKFGVWLSGNNTLTPTTEFSGSISNANQLTTSMAWYTFTGSQTLALDSHVGFLMQSGMDANIGVARVENVGQSTISDFTMTIKGSSGSWGNYNAGQVIYQEAFQTC